MGANWTPRVGWTANGFLFLIGLFVLNLDARSLLDALFGNGTSGAWTAVATIAIAAFTLLLWRATNQMRTISARQISHFEKAERAYVKISHKEPGVFFDSAGRVTVEVRNHGRAPASVTDIVLKALFLKKGQGLPVKPDYSMARTAPTNTAFLVTNDYIYTGLKIPNLADREKELRSGDEVMYVIGYVDYIDSFGGHHRGGYARVYVPKSTSNNLLFAGYRAYNYDRVRVPGEGKDWND
jgi:hypothetical protein